MATNHQPELELFANPPSTLTRRFLGWQAPLLDLAAQGLAEDWTTGPLDLSSLLVIVPTRNASRRLRERLAIEASQKETGVLPPLILNPDDLLLPAADELPVASKAEALAAWIDVLLEADLSQLYALFPVPPVAQNFSWALATAQEFTSVQSLLGEGAHNASYAAKVLASHNLEPERWEQFAELERETFAKLEKKGLQARSQARRQAIEDWHLPAGIEKLILLGLPDPPPAFEPLIERVADSHSVEAWIHAPEEEASHFDLFGKPTEAWNNRHLAISPEQIFQATSPSAQASRACERLASHPEPHRYAAVAVSDPEVVAPLQKSLRAQGWNGFDPAGKPFGQEGLCHLLRLLGELAGSERLAVFRDLLRIPGVAEAANTLQSAENPTDYPPESYLNAFDAFHEEHLCETLQDARNIRDAIDSPYRPPLSRALQWIEKQLRALRSLPLEDSLPTLLAEIYQHVPAADGEHFASVVQTLNQVLAEVAELDFKQGAEAFQLLLTLLEEQLLPTKREPQAIELPGWLELPWEDAPHIILTGCNDGLLPESIQSHPWLPNQARVLLGLRHNESRQARDTYLMASLIASRKEEGQVDFLFGRVNGQNDPLRPSRLLLAAPAEELPERVQVLFTEDENESTPLPWNMAWQLTPSAPDPDRFQRMSVTSFSKYLACPLRYYLEFGLRMREPDLERMELNARDFGTLTHLVLEDFAETSAAHSESEKEISECFQDLLSTRLAATYSPNLPAPLLIQADSIRQRLTWWATHEARQRAEGWTILETETYLAPKEAPFLIEGMVVNGQIDRIETHPEEGLRLLDFKTKAKPKRVVAAHLRKLKRQEEEENFPSWQLVSCLLPAHCWTNLQIPLYLLALSKRFPNQSVKSGYVQLGASKGDVLLDLWDELDEELLESARLCAVGVVQRIQERVFWPPAENPEYDSFSDLLLGDAASAVDPVNLTPRRSA